MKKFLIAAIAVLGFTTANAQYTAEKGDLQTSIDFRPFESKGDVFSNAGINATYFLTNKDAVRVRLNFASESVKDSNSSSNFGIAVGYENHFKAYDRIDVYAGAQISFDSNTKKETEFVNNTSYDLKSNGSNSQLGVQAFTGVNVYVYKKLYLGAEIQFGYTNTSASKYETLDYDNNGNIVVKEVDPKSSSNSFGFKVLPAIRLGWTF